MILTFIVNGEDVRVLAETDAPLIVAMRRARKISRNTARPDEDWELRNMTGLRVNELETPQHAGDRFFLTLHAGAGG